MNDVHSNLWRILFWLSLAATLYTYFLYPALLMILSRCQKRRLHPAHLQPMTDQELPTVTMVVSAYNEQQVLPEKLANCRLIDYPADKIRFLLGSDGSDDATAAILEGIADIRFRTVVCPHRQGKVKMLNGLMKMVNSELVVFSDANTMYQPDALRQLVAEFRDATVGCVIGKLELTAADHDEQACQTEGLYWRYENRLKQMESTLGAVPTVNGGILAIRRELYQSLPEYAVTEDQVLGMKIMTAGYRCVFAEAACAYESVSSWSGELRRRIRISAGNFQSLFLVPQILNPRCGRVHFAFVSHKLLRWLVPFFLVCMLLSNVLLAGQLFYGSTLLLQSLFYATGLLGVLLPKLTGMIKILSVPKYFLAMNAAILLGLIRFLSGRQKVTWAKTRN